MKTSTFGAISLASVFALASPAAAAESIGVVAVAEPPGPSAEAAELTHQLRLVAAERAQGVVDANELRERMAGQSSSATLSELDRAYAGALATYQNGDFEGAVRTLQAVVQDLEKLPAGAETFNQWTRAMLRLARAQQTLGRGGEAREVLERLVRANPAVKADPNQYPPSFGRQVEDVKAQVGMLVKKKLAISATAKNAKVFVEGREVGTAPITLDLPPGRYRVSGAVGSVRVPTVTVDLTEEGQAVSLNFALADALRPSFGPGLSLPEADRSKSLVAAGNWLGVDKLLAARLAKEAGVEYLVATYYDVRRGMLLREGRIRLSGKVAPAGSLSALAAFLLTGQASNLVAQTQTAGAPAEAAPAPKAAPAEAAPSSKTAAAKPEAKEAPPAKPSLAVKPQEAKQEVDFGKPAPEAKGGKSKTLGWVAFGAGALSVGLGGFAIYEGLSAKSKYDKASGLLRPDGAVQQNASVAQYKQYVSDGDSAKTMGYVTGGAAVGCAVVSGVLGYLSYKQTGEIGPFRF